MKKQKICIIGGNLTGLVTAISLSKLDCEVDLILDKPLKSSKTIRTIAISENNFNFLNKLNISKSLKKEMWVCSKMQLYTKAKNEKFSKVFELNRKNEREKILYMSKNSIIEKIMINKIKKTKSISIKQSTKVSIVSNSGLLKCVKINNNTFKYNLVIMCSGNKSNLLKNIFNGSILKNSYKELAFTTILSHKFIENTTVRQIFLKNEILALLPVSNTKTSVVWSVKNEMKKNNDFYFKKKIKNYTSNFLKNIKFINKIEKKELNFLIRSKYFFERTLLFGDALHVMHPFVGQGFNMTLRDLATLETILSKTIKLGLDIGTSDILDEFSRETKPRNFIFSIGSDILKNTLSFKKIRNDMFNILNKNNLAKDIIFNIADKGFRF